MEVNVLFRRFCNKEVRLYGQGITVAMCTYSKLINRVLVKQGLTVPVLKGIILQFCHLDISCDIVI